MGADGRPSCIFGYFRQFYVTLENGIKQFLKLQLKLTQKSSKSAPDY